MAGITGILEKGCRQMVTQMLEKISYRGNYSKKVLELEDATVGIVWSWHEDEQVKRNLEKNIFIDGSGFGHCASCSKISGEWVLRRDELGSAPVYYTKNSRGSLCFASEIKALLPVNLNVHELLPGHSMHNGIIKQDYFLEQPPVMNKDPEEISSELLFYLAGAVTRRISSDSMGAWLSGGLDSSAIAALAKPWLNSFHTFSGGLKDAPDLTFAREVAKHIGSQHHEIILTPDDIFSTLPELIYHLESFDPLLVRSSVVNFLVAKTTSEFVGEVFSGEGADEFFAGYEYLKSLPENILPDELEKIAGNLHNTAFQRVDRCASAFGTTAHIAFADPILFEYALKIPVHFKLHDGVEKWILRKAVKGILPDNVVNRKKSKFWQGSGVEGIIADYASEAISDHDFKAQRHLKNGWTLNSKEELFYYRIFTEAFGELEDLDWMGRSQTTSNT